MIYTILIPYLIIILCSVVAILQLRRDPYVSIMWILITISIPIIGILLFILFGYRRDLNSYHNNGHTKGIEGIAESYCANTVKYRNEVSLLKNGASTFSSLIDLLQHARESINFEYYMLCDDRIGRAIVNILCRRSRSGVKVRVLLDAVGSKTPFNRLVKLLKRAGIEVVIFSPIRFSTPIWRINRRNHRKIVVVDGQIAMLGGVNVAQYYMDGNSEGCWRDQHILIKGEVVKDIQTIFLRDWHSSGGEEIALHQITPHKNMLKYGNIPIQIIYAEQGASRHAILSTFTAIITRAHSRVLISSPYCMPPREILSAINIAVRSGVEVKILTSLHSLSRLLDLASESYFEDILATGADLYCFTRGFVHAKIVIADDVIASVGSANFDYRSMEHNYEVGALIYDKDIINELAIDLIADINSSQHIQLSDIGEQSGWIHKMGMMFSRLLVPII